MKKQTIEEIGDNHILTNIETPLLSNAFEKSDDGMNMHLGWGTDRIAVPFTK